MELRPECVTILGVTSSKVEQLKRDSFGRVELVSDCYGRWIRRVACGGALPMSRAIARALLRREARALQALDGMAGVPQLVERARFVALASPDGVVPHPDDVLVRSYVDGTPLHRCTELPCDFFERLAELVRQLHARGVAHNDLHKEQNIVVGQGGAPHLIDFQLASVHSPDSRTLAKRAADDLRHVAKHQRRYLRFTRVEDERWAPAAHLRLDPPRPARRRGAALVWRKTAKPLYNFVTRRVLQRRDGEERRETRGPWPVWCEPVARRN